MKVAFVGHSYHGITRSNDFFLELLRRLGDVTLHYDESWLSGASPTWPTDIRPQNFDCVVVYQMPKLIEHLDLRHPNIVFVPMLDNHYTSDFFWWEESFSRAKVLCFSATLHREIARCTPARHFAQYAPPAQGLPALASPEQLSAFFWYRQPPIDLALLAELTGKTVFDRLTLQRAPDPGASDMAGSGSAPLARASEQARPWVPVRGSYLARLAEHTVYFAPRLYEGIGMGFLEAMALGLCVVAPDTPTHNEYISHGATGLLYSPARPAALDFGGFRELGRRARESAARRRARWEGAVPDVLEFLSTPKEGLDRRRRLVDFWRREPAPVSTEPAGTGDPRPSITVVVVRGDDESGLGVTLASLREQKYPGLVLRVLDRRPDATASDLRTLSDAVARTESEYVLFLHEGDRLVSRASLAQLLHGAPPGADVVYGHFVSSDREGVEDLCLVAEIEMALAQLEASGFDPRWMRRVPCLQATAFRVSTFRQHGFDPDLRVAADFDLHCRLVRAGACYSLSDAVVALCGPAGSWSRFLPLCAPEWLRIAVRHRRAHGARRSFAGRALSSAEAWEWTLRGWLDRAGRRHRARFGEAPWCAGASAGGRLPAPRRRLDAGVRALARHLASAERYAAAHRPAARRAFAEPQETYLAELAEGIDFSRPGLPSFVARLDGVSWREAWGRWTDGPRVEIELHRVLPARASIVLECFAFGEIASRPIEVAVGAASTQLAVTGGEPFRTYSVDLETSGRETKLTLTIPLPTLPVARVGVESGDPRRLGLALRKLQILEIPAPPDGAG